jgi:hypothetical protein
VSVRGFVDFIAAPSSRGPNSGAATISRDLFSARNIMTKRGQSNRSDAMWNNSNLLLDSGVFNNTGTVRTGALENESHRIFNTGRRSGSEHQPSARSHRQQQLSQRSSGRYNSCKPTELSKFYRPFLQRSMLSHMSGKVAPVSD